ncbi:hypothetical protein AMATHDRAFT_50064 [Amanita thiersii Skay4041]|uniref:ubiquitinyl hydrolase 1 n=1 Tax=Amanita thiersii Skay4041 TaxID=703135 RepID=A0A2A9NJ61_9AGAR|nr:hypothetical protein AMATHDRAFT_50064 [Amanita thiersii Skay4041]
MLKPKPPSPQELYRARKEKEEQTRTAYLPPGLINHGNTCFMNSVLQGLLATQLLSNLVHFTPIPDHIQQRAHTSLLSYRSPQLINGHGIAGPYERPRVDTMPIGDQLFDFLYHAWGVQSARHRESLSPRAILTALGVKYQQYLDFAQQDAHEFLRVLLDAMRMEEMDVIKVRQPPLELKKSKKKRRSIKESKHHAIISSSPPSLSSASASSNPSPHSTPPESPIPPFASYPPSTVSTNPTTPQTSQPNSPPLPLLPLPDMVFRGQLTSVLVCQKCHRISQTYEDFYDLSLGIKPDDYHSSASSSSHSFTHHAFSSLRRSKSTKSDKDGSPRKHERKRDKFKKLAKKIAVFPVTAVSSTTEADSASAPGPATQRPPSVLPGYPSTNEVSGTGVVTVETGNEGSGVNVSGESPDGAEPGKVEKDKAEDETNHQDSLVTGRLSRDTIESSAGATTESEWSAVIVNKEDTFGDMAELEKEPKGDNDKRKKDDDNWSKIRRISATVGMTMGWRDEEKNKEKERGRDQLKDREQEEKIKERKGRSKERTTRDFGTIFDDWRPHKRSHTRDGHSPDTRSTTAMPTPDFVEEVEPKARQKPRPVSTPPAIHLSLPSTTSHRESMPIMPHSISPPHQIHHYLAKPQEPVFIAPIPKLAVPSPLSQPPYQPASPLLEVDEPAELGDSQPTSISLPEIPSNTVLAPNNLIPLQPVQSAPVVQRGKASKPPRSLHSTPPPPPPQQEKKPQSTSNKPGRAKPPKPSPAEAEYIKQILADIDTSGSASSATLPGGFSSSSPSTFADRFSSIMRGTTAHGSVHSGWSHHHNTITQQTSGSGSIVKSDNESSVVGSTSHKLSSWLGISRLSGVEECLRLFTSVEVLDGENMVACRRCWKLANGTLTRKEEQDEDESEEEEDGDEDVNESDTEDEDEEDESEEGEDVGVQARHLEVNVDGSGRLDGATKAFMMESTSSRPLAHDHHQLRHTLPPLQHLQHHPPPRPPREHVFETPGGMPIPTISTTEPELPSEPETPSRSRAFVLRSNSADFVNLSSFSSYRDLTQPVNNTLGRTASSPSIASLASPYLTHVQSPYDQLKGTTADNQNSLVIPSVPLTRRKVKEESTDGESDYEGDSGSATESRNGEEAGTPSVGSLSPVSVSASPSGGSSALQLPPENSNKSEQGVGAKSTSKRIVKKSSRSPKQPKPVMMRPAYKRYLIATPPPVLVVHLKRFQQTNKTPWLSLTQTYGFKKLEDYVSFPEYLDLTPFLAPKREDFQDGKKAKSLRYKNYKAEGNTSVLPFQRKSQVKGERCMYRLYAVVVHFGNMLGGHYTAYTALPDHPPDNRSTSTASGTDPQSETAASSSETSPTISPIPSSTPASKPGVGRTTTTERQWAYISDTDVRLTTIEEVLKAKAYICMYERI